MNSIKIKLSLIANLIAIFALIVLGIVSFYFTKTSLYESTLKNQTDLLKVTQSTVEDKALLKIKLIYLKSHNLPLKISVPQINLLLEL